MILICLYPQIMYQKWKHLFQGTILKENATLKHIVLWSKELYKNMNFDTNLIKTGGELRKLWTTEYFNIGGMGAAILNI